MDAYVIYMHAIVNVLYLKKKRKRERERNKKNKDKKKERKREKEKKRKKKTRRIEKTDEIYNLNANGEIKCDFKG